jgi:hypothetical protein
MGNLQHSFEINKLKSASDIKGRIKEVFSNDDLNELAKNHGLPHYVVYNPITKVEYIYFNPQDLNDWFEANCLKRNDFIIDQHLHFINFNAADHKASLFDAIPPQLSKIRNLYKLPIEILSTPPGIYFLCMDEEIVYVGQALCVAKRISEHINDACKEFNQVYFIPCLKDRLNDFEMALIREFKPKYNFSNYGTSNERDIKIIGQLSD